MQDKKFKMPPGQRITSRWYAISVLGKPNIKIEEYRLKIIGLVKEEKFFTYKEILSLPAVEKQFDIHCVDGWSYLGPTFKGIYPKTLFRNIEILPNGKFALIRNADGYTTDLPLSFLLSNNVLLAYEAGGKPLTVEHGYPLRLVVNGKYAYKDAKWVSEIEITNKDIPGYWEKRGYSKSADIYKEERFEK